jgi:hypothetical protein
MAMKGGLGMKPLLSLALLLTAALTLSAADVTGIWEVKYSGSPRTGPKTVGSMILDLKVNGDIVTGTVVIGAWPGEAPISDGKIDGNHITFTATGNRGSTTGIPTCQFDVAIQDDEMHVRLITIKNGGGPLPLGGAFDYAGTRKLD